MKTDLASSLLVLIVVAAVQLAVCGPLCWDLSPVDGPIEGESGWRASEDKMGHAEITTTEGGFILSNLDETSFPNGEDLHGQLKDICNGMALTDIRHWKVAKNETDDTLIAGFILGSYRGGCVEEAVKYVPADPIYCANRDHANGIYSQTIYDKTEQSGPKFDCQHSPRTTMDVAENWVKMLGYGWDEEHKRVKF